MTRKVKTIIAQLRRDAACPQVEVTLLQTEDLLALCDAAERKPKKLTKPKPEAIDRAVTAYNREKDRWCSRLRLDKDGFELVRNSSPKNNVNADRYMQITPLSKRYCSSHEEAEMWLGIWSGRAAVLAALEVL